VDAEVAALKLDFARSTSAVRTAILRVHLADDLPVEDVAANFLRKDECDFVSAAAAFVEAGVQPAGRGDFFVELWSTDLCASVVELDQEGNVMQPSSDLMAAMYPPGVQ
jgi:hypothetical protein